VWQAAVGLSLPVLLRAPQASKLQQHSNKDCQQQRLNLQQQLVPAVALRARQMVLLLLLLLVQSLASSHLLYDLAGAFWCLMQQKCQGLQ
jgi:hypothetical protein